MFNLKFSVKSILAGLGAFLLVSCSATGGPFGLSPEQQQALGEQQHPQIVAAFGGELNDPQVVAYVESIHRRLMQASGRPEASIKMTVLDSPVINAMALPGHVYVTRGLLALANSEAELAGVIGHEIGHVFEQHTAERVSRGNVAGLGAVLVGILSGSQDTAQIAGQAAQLYLLRFSRSQEYEADGVGVRLLAQAGYDPTASADFLNSLGRWSALESRISGRQGPPEFLSTHPNSAERVRRAAAEAQVLNQGGLTAERSRAQYLTRIDGLLYGDDPRRQGYVEGTNFIHPDLRFAFTVPNGFQILNTSTAVIAQSQQTGAQMQFTLANSQETPSAIIQGPLAQQLKVNFGQVRQIRVAGRPAAVGVARANTQQGAVDVQAYVIQWQGTTNYLFLWVTPTNVTRNLQNSIERSVASLRDVNPDRLNVPPTRRVDIATVQPRDSVASLSSLMAFPDYREERFRIFNSLGDAENVQAGRKVKLVR